MSAPARGEEVVAHFRTFDVRTAMTENWEQGETILDYRVPGTSSTIQGIICCVDLDNTKSWLLMILDASHTHAWVVSYLALTYGSWVWHWIEADDHLDACHEFTNWLICNDEKKMNTEVRP